MINALITLLIYVVVVGVIIWLIHYLVDNLPIADPFGRIAKVGSLVVGVVILIILLLGLLGGVEVDMPRIR